MTITCKLIKQDIDRYGNTVNLLIVPQYDDLIYYAITETINGEEKIAYSSPKLICGEVIKDQDFYDKQAMMELEFFMRHRFCQDSGLYFGAFLRSPASAYKSAA
jgi:hypothetical protein